MIFPSHACDSRLSKHSQPLRQTPSTCDEIAVDNSFTLLAPIRSSGTKAGGGAEGVTLVVVGTSSRAHIARSGFGAVLWISGTSRNEPAPPLRKRLRWGSFPLEHEENKG